MPKVYDPILCMVVDKPATRTTDAKVTDGMYMFKFKSGRTDTMKLDSDQEAISMGKQLLKTYNEPYAKITTNGGRNVVATVGTLHDKSTIDKAIKTIDANGEPLVNLKTGVTVGWIIDKGKRLVKNSYGNVYKVSVGDLAWLISKQSKGIVPEDIKAVGERMIDLE